MFSSINSFGYHKNGSLGDWLSKLGRRTEAVRTKEAMTEAMIVEISRWHSLAAGIYRPEICVG
jgi:hypothetical protein